MIQILWFILGCLALAEAQISFQGKCPRGITPKKDFELHKFLGKWYEYEKYDVGFETGGKCVSAIYSPKSDCDFKVLIKQLKTETGQRKLIDGVAKIVGPLNEAKFDVVLPEVTLGAVLPVIILETDYFNYCVFYSCTENAYQNFRIVWVMTRERYPCKEVIDKAYGVLYTKGISMDHLKKTDHVNCPIDC